MLKTGTVPVLPSGLNGPRKFFNSFGPRNRGCSEHILGQQGLTNVLCLVKGAKVSQPAEEEDEEEELRKLQAEMAM